MVLILSNTSSSETKKDLSQAKNLRCNKVPSHCTDFLRDPLCFNKTRTTLKDINTNTYIHTYIHNNSPILWTRPDNIKSTQSRTSLATKGNYLRYEKCNYVSHMCWMYTILCQHLEDFYMIFHCKCEEWYIILKQKWGRMIHNFLFILFINCSPKQRLKIPQLKKIKQLSQTRVHPYQNQHSTDLRSGKLRVVNFSKQGQILV